MTILLVDEALKEIENHGLSNDDVDFVKELIDCQRERTSQRSKDGKKNFYYESVSNKVNGIDVDKFDYLTRDAYHTGIRSSFEKDRLLKLSRVVFDDRG